MKGVGGPWAGEIFEESAIENDMILKIDSGAKLAQSNRFGGHRPNPAGRAEVGAE